jgi:hypothetical protein
MAEGRGPRANGRGPMADNRGPRANGRGPMTTGVITQADWSSPFSFRSSGISHWPFHSMENEPAQRFVVFAPRKRSLSIPAGASTQACKHGYVVQIQENRGGARPSKKMQSPLDPGHCSGYDTASSSPRSRSRHLVITPLDRKAPRRPGEAAAALRGRGSCEGTGITSPTVGTRQGPSPGKSAVVSASGERRSRWEGLERLQSF